MTESCNLSDEFLEYKDSIHTLKMSDHHFSKLFDTFQEIDKAIQRSSQRIDLLSEVEEEKLRKQRLKIKDEIYSILKASTRMP